MTDVTDLMELEAKIAKDTEARNTDVLMVGLDTTEHSNKCTLPPLDISCLMRKLSVSDSGRDMYFLVHDCRLSRPPKGISLNPFIVLSQGPRTACTKTKNDTVLPLWNELVRMKIDEELPSNVAVEVWTEDEKRGMVLLAKGAVCITNHLNSKFMDERFSLQPVDEKLCSSCRVRVSCSFVRTCMVQLQGGLFPLNNRQIKLIEETWHVIEEELERWAAVYNHHICKHHPHAARVFYNLRGEERDLAQDETVLKTTQAFLRTIGMVVAGLSDEDTLIPFLVDLGLRHQSYGVTPRDFEPVGGALIATLEQALGSTWSEEVRAAWVGAFESVSAVMKLALDDTADQPRAHALPVAPHGDQLEHSESPGPSPASASAPPARTSAGGGCPFTVGGPGVQPPVTAPAPEATTSSAPEDAPAAALNAASGSAPGPGLAGCPAGFLGSR